MLQPLFLLLIALVSATAFAVESQRYSIDVKGKSRSYLVHLPPNTGSNPLPVVLIFHGGGGSGEQIERTSGMDESADRYGFIAVYPNGSGERRRDILLTWNAGNCCAYAMEHHIDDVAFVAAPLDDLPHHVAIDTRRIYATGMSNGAMMAHLLGDMLPNRIAAIAAVSGAHIPSTNIKDRALPVMHIHSVDDPRAHYEGGLSLPFPLSSSKGVHPPVDEMMARWVKKDGCKNDPAIAAQRSEGTHTATKYVYGGCRDGVEVVLWKLTGSGHVWPGVSKSFGRKAAQTTSVISANDEVWNFVSQYSLPN
jgi:polyhydroxybutyrate depolymerase